MPPSRERPVLTLRALDRALLARQLLLKRVRLAPADAIERLGALQAQWPPAPYIALWSRLAGFTVAALERALEERSVVKATVMRGTLHLVSAPDYPYYAVASPEARRAAWASFERAILRYWGGQSEETKRFVAKWPGLGDHTALHAALLRHARTPRTRDELIEFMAAQTRMPVELARHFIWAFIAAYGGLVHVPGSAAWSSRGSRELVAARTVLGRAAMPSFAEAVTHTVRRHLGAFGPATIADIASWTHVRTSPIREALAVIGPELREFSDERGRRLYDLARSPRPAEDTPAPVRFLAKWDSPLLAYAPPERVRILSEALRSSVIAKNGDVVPTVLVDGTVAARWGARMAGRTAVLEVAALRRLASADRAEIEMEGARLIRFIHPEAGAHDVRSVGAAKLPLANLSLRP
ncbi:MAG TPA: winged helix DNA-binding domain-containing protein [Candidatus Limnocylindria bacterium]|nr:winged helix DNA-binding domain-containing protein [Candidatus Limnocylindria bacterium]